MLPLQDIIQELERLAPLRLQESYDNSGLITGDPSMNINSALICLDSTEAVIDEAIRRGCNLVIAHHPIVFSGLKKITLIYSPLAVGVLQLLGNSIINSSKQKIDFKSKFSGK